MTEKPDMDVVAEVHTDGLSVRKARFWLVWNKGANPPRISHNKKAQADAEAQRLARENPGQTFIVLEATHKYKLGDG